jgi:hypothetical protein
MDINNLSTIVSLIGALSVASERLVEIIKGFIKCLNEPGADAEKEGWRRSYLHLLATFSGIVTTFLAHPVIPKDIFDPQKPDHYLRLLALGLLASGGSGLWNSVLTYLGKIKDLKKLEIEEKKKS